ncbi:glycoside hydrolase family 2 protein, partial [candidate division KSB1 bacterium]|nr:glycoside hydrolase family 2 protein [candidate division KSB1 bacterium]
MQTIDLNGCWQVTSEDGAIALDTKVPGTVMYALEQAGYFGEKGVFYRENNRACLDLANRAFVFRREFQVSDAFLQAENGIFLEADGLDTLAEIRINGQTVAKVENMFVRWRFDVRKYVRAGKNDIAIHFGNAVAEIASRNKKRPLWNDGNSLDGAVHLRKNHCSFGWDWGPVIPDVGIWQPIRLRAYPGLRIKDFRVAQKHDDGDVWLDFSAEVERWSPAEYEITVSVTCPDGDSHFIKLDGEGQARFEVPAPQLWWPRGLGEQPLYRIEVSARCDGQIADQRHFHVGLRTLELQRELDEWGESFQLSCNGVAFFACGANLVPPDVYLTRADDTVWQTLVDDAVAANFNCLRIWGGGIYPPDCFFDFCDQCGIVVWQDLMYACGLYDIDNPAFYENIKNETINVLERIRHHASLGLICGNNEMEWAFDAWDFEKTAQMRSEYRKQYEQLFPEIVQQICPQIAYWPASPSSGGGFDRPNAPERGDVHYWEVWHGNKPFTDYRNYHFRFLSEFGFESFPSFKTIASFAEPEDRNIFSTVMEDHQRCVGGNGKILTYISHYFRYPKNFESLLYISQLSQAEAIRYGVEHLRRNRGRCMGAIYWQYNDNWPVASWSSVDCFGRWKALHYAARRMFDPILLSCEESGTTARLSVSNEKPVAVEGLCNWRLLSLAGEVIREGELSISVPALSAHWLCELDFSAKLEGRLKRERYLSLTFRDDAGGEIRQATCAFVPYKHL